MTSGEENRGIRTTFSSFIPSTLLSFPSLKPFFSGLYNPGRVEKSRYLCNQSARLLSLGAESFSRFELIAGWNVIKVRIEVAPHEDAAISRKRKFLPLVLIRASLPSFSTSFHVSFKDRPSKRSVFSIFKKVFSPPPPLFFFWEEKIIIVAVIIVIGVTFVGSDDKVIIANKVAVRYFILSFN